MRKIGQDTLNYINYHHVIKPVDHELLLPIGPDEVNYSNGRIPQNPGYN